MDDEEQQFMSTMQKFRVWHIPQLGCGAMFYQEVPDIKIATLLTQTLAAYDLFQYENNLKPDYANANGVEGWDGTEWQGIDDIIERMEEEYGQN